jgi:phosphoribosylformylglycinamidine (FGAM) synthase-like enzyme
VIQKVCRDLIYAEIISSAHDCSDGGLAVALAESSINSSMGFKGDFNIDGRWDIALFGEAQSRIIVSLDPKKINDLRSRCNLFGVEYCILGRVIDEKQFTINSLIDIDLGLMSETSDTALNLLS